MAKKTPKLDANGYRKFGMRDCLAYAAGDLGCNMSFALKGTMALFWTQVMGLSAWYSLLIVILQVWDAINDPLIGSIVDSDRHTYKRNKFLQYIFVGSIGLIVGGALCFLPFPNAPVWAKIVIFMAGYVIWDAFYTVANVPYGSLLSLISGDPADRASLSAWRSIGSMVGNMLPMVILPFLIYNEDESLNGPMVFVAALIMGVIGFFCFQFMIKNTEVRVNTNVTSTRISPSLTSSRLWAISCATVLPLVQLSLPWVCSSVCRLPPPPFPSPSRSISEMQRSPAWSPCSPCCPS